MDDIAEVVIFIVVGVVYTLWNLFTNKGEDGAAPSRSPRQKDESGGSDGSYAERQRKIREEIRRKIAERRGESLPVPAPLVERAPVTPPLIRTKESPPVIPAYLKPAPSASASSDDGRFSWDESDDAYSDGLQDRLDRIEQTKRQAAALRAKASNLGVKKGSSDSFRSDRSGGGVLSGPVKRALTKPSAARAAFVYSEVLGAPISLRDGASDVPGLRA